MKESALLRTLHNAIGSSASPVRQAPSEQRRRLAPQKKLHVLVAEDNLVNQAVARALLTKWGHTLAIAPNGREAVALQRKGHFDICLMDVSAAYGFGGAVDKLWLGGLFLWWGFDTQALGLEAVFRASPAALDERLPGRRSSDMLPCLCC